MKEKLTCIAIDLGAGSIRVMLGTLDTSGISYKEVHRITNKIVEIDGHDRWDMDNISSAIRKGIAMAVESSGDLPQSVGVNSWGVDFVLLDDKGKLLDIPIAYRDGRTKGMHEVWQTYMSDMQTFERTGINFYIFNTLFQLLSLKGSKDLERTSKIVFIPGYISYLLTGKIQNELSISSTSQMLGVDGKQWDDRILDILQLDRELFGEVIDPGTLLGPVILPELNETGMEGIAVCGHDTACVAAAIPVENPNFAYISAGTWCVVGIESDKPLVSEEAFKQGLTNERGYNNTYRILKNMVGLWLLQGLKKHLPEGTSFSDMEKMTLQVGQIMQVIDPDDPLFYNPKDMKEAFDSYFARSGQSEPEDFGGYILCAYDSICYSIRYQVEILEKLSGKPIEVLHLVGGGSQSDYLNQRIATICKRRVVSGPVEGATLGNILVQALALGKIESIEEGRRLVKQSCPLKKFEPLKEPDRASERYERFLRLKHSQA